MRKLILISQIGLIALSVISLTVCAVCFLYIPRLLSNEILQEDYIGRYSNGTYNDMLKNYVNPPYYMQLQIWTFSVTNADDVIKNGAKPILVEKGPYSFVETQNKIVEFKNGTNDTRLYYRNNRHYYFNQTLSCAKCDLSDRVTVPNLVFQKLIDKKFFIAKILPYIKETVYINVNVNDLLFNGYEDFIIKKICNKKWIRPACKFLGIPARIGLFYEKNNTDDELYEIDTGHNNVLNLGHVYSWNKMAGKLDTKYWFGDKARMINGTDSQLFPPKKLLKRENFYIFSGQACRSVEMEFHSPVDVFDLPVSRYVPAKSMYDMKLQKEMGFCNPETPVYFSDTKIQEPGCLPSGLMDMSSCIRAASRIYISNAHFFDSPAPLRSAVEGMAEPDAKNDNTFLDIEPLTGVVVHVQRRSQINVGVLSRNFKVLKNTLKATIVPMVWMNESVIFDPNTREKLLQVVNIMRYSNIAAVCSAFIGVVLFVAYLLITFFVYRRNIAPANDETISEYVAVDTSFFDAGEPQGIDNHNFTESDSNEN